MISYSVYLLHPLVFNAYRSVPVLHRTAHDAGSGPALRRAPRGDHRAERADLLPGREADAAARPPGGGPVQATPRRPPSPDDGVSVRDGRIGGARAAARRAVPRSRAGPAAPRSGPRPRSAAYRAAGRCARPGCGPRAAPARQEGDPEAGRYQGLRRDEVVGGERDPRGEPGRRALLEQVLAAAVAAGDPAVLRQPRQVGGPQFGHRGRQRRLAAADCAAVSGMIRCTVSDSSTCSRMSAGLSRPRLACYPSCPHRPHRPHRRGDSPRSRAPPPARRRPPRAGRSARRPRTRPGASAPLPAAPPRSAAGRRWDAARAGSPPRPGTMVLRAEGNAASRSRPARSPAKTASSFSAASRRPITSVARSASSRPASVSRMPRPARWTSLVPVSASRRARWWLTDGWA